MLFLYIINNFVVYYFQYIITLQSIPIWLGGLLNPEAYITATRQCVAQANSWSLEELHLQVFYYEHNIFFFI